MAEEVETPFQAEIAEDKARREASGLTGPVCLCDSEIVSRVNPCPVHGTRFTRDELRRLRASRDAIDEDRKSARALASAAITERDRLRRLIVRLDAAVSHHKKRHQPDGLLFAEAADEALWDARDKVIRDWQGGRG